MSNSSDKPATHNAPLPVTEPEARPSDAPAAGSGLPSYMAEQTTPLATGQATSAGSGPELGPEAETERPQYPGAADETAPEPDVPEPDAPGPDAARPAPAAPSLGEAVRAAQQDAGPAIAVTPDGDAHMPPQADDGAARSADADRMAGQDKTGGSAATDPEAPQTPWWRKDAATPQSDASVATGTTGTAGPAAAAAGKNAPGAAGQASPSATSGAPGAKTGAQRPASVSFGKSHPVLAVEQTMPPSMTSRLYTVFAVLPLLWLTLSVILQTLFSLNARELWTGQEAVNAALLQGLAQQGPTALLPLNAEAFTAQPPLYIWFLRGLYEAFRTDGPMLHLAAAAVSCLLYLWAVLGLGRCVGRLDGRSNLASGIILLSTGAVAALAHHASSELFFAALVTASLILLYRSFVSAGNSPLGMILAFILAGAASLAQGPLGIAIPVLAVVLFALWRGSAAQTRCVLVSVLALLCGLAPVLYGLPILQAFGLLADASALSMEWGLALLAPPALLLLALAAFSPGLRVCAALSLLLMIAAFVLTGGTPYFNWPLGYALPCLLAALFVLWQLTPQRLFRLDFFIGIAAGLATIAVWPALIFLESGSLTPLTDALLKEYVLTPALAALALEGGWLRTLALLPLLLLPWLLALLFLPWHGFLGKTMREGLAASRRPEKEGLAFLWCAALAVLLLVCALKDQSVLACLPALGPLACLTARAVMGFAGRRASGFRIGMAVLTLAAGVLTILYGLMLFGILPQPAFLGLPEWKMASHGGFFVTGAILLVAGALIWFGLGSSRPEGVLLIALLTVTGLGYPLGSLMAPHFDGVMSPKAQALMLRAYADKGYAAASYDVPKGAYAFYAGTTVKPLDAVSPENLAALGQNAVLAMPAADFDALADKPEGLAVAQRQWMGCREYVLLASPVIDGLPPASVSYKPAPDIIDELLQLTGLDAWLKSFRSGEKTAPAAPAQPAPEAVEPAQPEAAEPAPETPGAAAPAQPEPAPETPEPPAQESAPVEAADGAAAQETPAGDTPAEEVPLMGAPAGDAPASSPAATAPSPEQAATPGEQAPDAAPPAEAQETADADAPAEAQSSAPEAPDAAPPAEEARPDTVEPPARESAPEAPGAAAATDDTATNGTLTITADDAPVPGPAHPEEDAPAEGDAPQ